MTYLYLSIIFLLLTLLSALQPSSVFAHVLKTDGNIGAVLHIDPEDDPIVGQQAGYFFEFKDKQGKFNPQNCDCTFSIFQGGKHIFSQPLFQSNSSPSLQSASVFFTFVQRDVYQIKVVGKPNPPGVFQPFTLVYDVRVARQLPSQPAANWFSTHLIHFAGAGIILLFIVAALLQKLFAKVTSSTG